MKMTKGIDEHFANGGSMDEFEEVSPKDHTGLKKAIIDAKRAGAKQNARRISDFILKNCRLMCSHEKFFILERNDFGGAYYRELDEDRELFKAIEKVDPKNYTRTLREDVKEYLANATYVRFELLNRFDDNLNVLNGVVDIKTRRLRQFSMDDRYTYQIPIKFDPEAVAPKFKAFRRETFAGNDENIQLVKTIFGYCLQTEKNSEKFFIFAGKGGNGKGVMTHILESILGKQNCCTLSLSDLANDKKTHMLVGALANISNESSAKARDWSENLKTAVSGEAMLADIKYRPIFKFYPFAKHIFSMNEPPHLEDKSEGVMRRMVIVPFNNAVEEELRNPKLKYELIEKEGPGILNDCLEGLENYQKYGFIVPEANKKAALQIKIESDSVMGFVTECCELGEDLPAIATDEFYQSYSDWCQSTGHGRFSKTKVTRSLRVNYDIDCRVTRFFNELNPKRGYYGIRIVK